MLSGSSRHVYVPNPPADQRRWHDGAVIRTGIGAGLVAGVLSGAPSTAYALLTGRDPLAATRAAGALLVPDEVRTSRLLAAAVPVHFGISAGWGLVLAAVLPRRATVWWGAVAGLAIAAVDLRLPGRRTRPVRALAIGPQVADHLAFGAIVGIVIRARRAHDGTSSISA